MTRKKEAIQEPLSHSCHDVFGTEDNDNSSIDWSATVKDLSNIVVSRWPGNSSQRQGSFYINLNWLDMKTGQESMIGYFPEGFVLERVDVHCLAALDTPMEFAIFMGKTEPITQLGLFGVEAESNHVSRMSYSETQPGTYVYGNNIYLKTKTETPLDGRILIVLTGYQIEPWR